MQEQANFKQVMAHSKFKISPLATINEHLRNKMQKEQEEEMEDHSWKTVSNLWLCTEEVRATADESLTHGLFTW